MYLYSASNKVLLDLYHILKINLSRFPAMRTFILQRQKVETLFRVHGQLFAHNLLTKKTCNCQTGSCTDKKCGSNHKLDFLANKCTVQGAITCNLNCVYGNTSYC